MTIATYQVSASADDAAQDSGGNVNITATSSTITSAAGWYGVRFTSTGIPQGATIVWAYLEFYIVNTTNDSPNFNIYADSADAPAAFTTTLNDISSRGLSTAFVAWSGTDIGSGFKATADMASVVQERVSDAGWNGNIAFLLDAQTGVSVNIRNYDGDTTQAAKLHVKYTYDTVDIRRGGVVHSSYDTIQAAVTAAIADDAIEIGEKDDPYYEAVTLAGKTSLTLRPKTGETPTICAAVEILAELPAGPPSANWVFDSTNNGRDIYYYSYTASNNNVQAVRSDGTRLWTYGSWDNFTNSLTDGNHAGEGIYYDDAADKLYITLTGNTDPNTVLIKVSSANYAINFDGTDSCIVEDLTIELGGDCVVRMSDSNSNTIRRCEIRYGQPVWIKSQPTVTSDDNIFEDLTLWDKYESHWTWEDVKNYTPKKMELSGFYQDQAGADNILRNSEIYGAFNGVFIGRATTGAPYVDGTLVYGCTIHDIRDDAYEIESYARNLQFYDNVVYDAYICLSFTPFYDGPCYIYRNRLIADKDGPSGAIARCTKRSASDTLNQVYIYHNTFYSEGDVIQVSVTDANLMTNVTFYNNVFISAGGSSGQCAEGSPQHDYTGNYFDGNCYYRLDSSAGNLLSNFDDATADYATLADYIASADGIASGWEASGLQANPLVDLLSAYPYPMTITSLISPLVGAGVSLPVGYPDNTVYAGNTMPGFQPLTGVQSTVLSRAGTFSTGTGALNSTVTVSGLPFMPKLILFWWSGQTSATDNFSVTALAARAVLVMASVANLSEVIAAPAMASAVMELSASLSAVIAARAILGSVMALSAILSAVMAPIAILASVIALLAILASVIALLAIAPASMALSAMASASIAPVAIAAAVTTPAAIAVTLTSIVVPSISELLSAAALKPMVGPRQGKTPVTMPVNQPKPSVSLLMLAPPLAGISIVYIPSPWCVQS